MEIDITSLFESDTWPFSGSIATHGANAGRDTWNAAKIEAAESPLLKTEDELQALRDHVQAMGFSDEVQDYDDDNCNALFIQLVSGDMREQGLDDMTADDDEAWAAFEASDIRETCGGSIFRCDIEGHASFGRVFYYLGD